MGQIYRAADVKYSELAERKLAVYERLGYGNLPVCMAKVLRFPLLGFRFRSDGDIRGRPI
jgi:formyltetrahydrofolate synthetase